MIEIIEASVQGFCKGVTQRLPLLIKLYNPIVHAPLRS